MLWLQIIRIRASREFRARFRPKGLRRPRSSRQAARGTQQVSSNISDVQRGAGETGAASSQVLSAAQSLSGDSHRLKLEVGKFLDSVRAA